MIQKTLKIVFLFSFFLILVSPVLAQESNVVTPSPLTVRQEKLEQTRERVREQIGTRHQLIQERQATFAAQLTQRHKERIRLFFNRLTQRIQAAITRLRRLIARIESRLEKIEASGEEITTTAVKASLVEAKEKLTQAETALAEAQASFEDILASEDPKEAFADTRDLIKGIKNQLIEIHQLLVHVIGDIRGLRVGQSQNEGGE